MSVIAHSTTIERGSGALSRVEYKRLIFETVGSVRTDDIVWSSSEGLAGR